jgi:hypothetical protein
LIIREKDMNQIGRERKRDRERERGRRRGLTWRLGG